MPKTDKRSHLIVGLILVIFGGLIIWWSLGRNSGPSVVIGGDTILVDIADESAEQERGLSGRPTLPRNHGMLFVYSQPSRPGFWMKDMRFPIDIVWIGEDNKIVAVLPNLNPDTYPAVFSPPEEVAPVRYVLEVNAGSAARLGWEAGATVQIKL